MNVLQETFARLGMTRGAHEYRARVYLTPEERAHGRALIGESRRPVLTFHTRTNEPVKDWPIERWREALAALGRSFHLVHLGDAREPMIEGVQRLAGRLTLRESMSVLAHARVHAGADSFLMHAANGLDIPSVIVFGGSRTPANVGYAANVNLFATMPCGPCWIHGVNGERCDRALACMDAITPDAVVGAVARLAGIAQP
jgi:ADP-heptose:LPS heptosyltransferase